MSTGNSRARFRVFDVEDQDYAEPTEQNMPKKLWERHTPAEVILLDVPAAFVVFWVGIPAFEKFILGIANPEPIMFSGGILVILLDIVIFGLGLLGLIVVPFHIIGLINHKKLQREEIVQWGVRGWVRSGLEPDDDMMEEIRRRKPYRPNVKRR